MINNPLFRPPAEAESLILQVDEGCSYNRCTFCAMYRSVPYQQRSLDEIEKLVVQESTRFPESRKIFLADGDVMGRSFPELETILYLLKRSFPKLVRVSLYANGSSILEKSDEQLLALHQSKLHTLYMGLESGDPLILKQCRKAQNIEKMITASVRAQAAGLRMSVMVLLGLGGIEHSMQHAKKTASALNRMQPRLLSTLRVIPIQGTELYDEVQSGTFRQLSEYDIVRELHSLIGQLELNNCVFRSNHTSNIIPLEGRLPKDKHLLLDQLDILLKSGTLDKKSPGPLPLWL
ncbi:MAG: radical SAM protein [Chlamydiota bacterium]|nr:radical SAM protein [Chlamydiota bacterium]